jgi:DNA-directed RNA polymerase specialized sigma24 family protein/CheY-like chemotaxis protein
MSGPQMVAKYLPFLRRYARVLTGTQTAGDAYVAATLEALVKEPSLLNAGGRLRVELFRLFTRIRASEYVDRAIHTGVKPAEQGLANLTPLPRQAFLLLALEGFREEDAAHILDCDVATLRRLVNDAGHELAADVPIDVLIIEDEVLISIDLEVLVENLGHRVIGVARTHAETIKLAKTRQPGLILADIQLADGSSGLDAVNEVLRSFEAPVVFITAHPERFLTGERPEPALLVSKPFQPAMVSAIASQALFFECKAEQRGPRMAAG